MKEQEYVDNKMIAYERVEHQGIEENKCCVSLAGAEGKEDFAGVADGRHILMESSDYSNKFKVTDLDLHSNLIKFTMQ